MRLKAYEHFLEAQRMDVLLIPIKYRKKIEDFLLEFSSFTLLNEMSDKFINEVIKTGRKTPD